MIEWEPAVYAIKAKGGAARVLVAGARSGPLGLHVEELNGKLHITHFKTGMRIGYPIHSLYHAMKIVERLRVFDEQWEKERPGVHSHQVELVFDIILSEQLRITVP